MENFSILCYYLITMLIHGVKYSNLLNNLIYSVLLVINICYQSTIEPVTVKYNRICFLILIFISQRRAKILIIKIINISWN